MLPSCRSSKSKHFLCWSFQLFPISLECMVLSIFSKLPLPHPIHPFKNGVTPKMMMAEALFLELWLHLINPAKRERASFILGTRAYDNFTQSEKISYLILKIEQFSYPHYMSAKQLVLHTEVFMRKRQMYRQMPSRSIYPNIQWSFIQISNSLLYSAFTFFPFSPSLLLRNKR